MNTRPLAYLSYLLRLWPVEDGGERMWRASLESARSGQRTGFASLDDLFDFLEQQISGGAHDLDRQEQPEDTG